MLGLALILCLHCPAASPQEKDLARRIDSLKREFDASVQSLRKEFEEARTPAEQQKVRDKGNGLYFYAGKMLDLAKENPGDAAAVEALIWIIEEGRTQKEKLEAAKLIVQHHAKDPRIGSVSAVLLDPGFANGVATLRRILAENPHRDVQGLAALNLGVHLKGQADQVAAKGNLAASSKLEKEAEQLLERVVREFGGIHLSAGVTLADAAQPTLFELRHLALGKTPPDIVGEDSAGKRLKLSDYRGKVVVLDFWASWCGPCMRMVPHERELVKRLEGKPFVLLGVNLDDDRQKLKETEARERMTWRSFFDGRDGAIARAWNVHSLPAIFVLDAKGVIRYKGVRDSALDATVNALLQEMQGP